MAGAAFLLLLVIANLMGYRNLHRARLEERALEEKVAAAEARIDEIRAKRDRLLEDPATLERLARENLRMARPGEVVLLIPEDEATDQAPPAQEGSS